MRVKVPAGKYVLAVSGGVDSMVLLHMLSRMDGLDLVIAHFDHGIRGDGALDKQLVERVAHEHGLKVEFGYGRLGLNTSEEKARHARYNFLDKVQSRYGAKAIITAHHQDDLIETAFLNLLRGSGRRGLSSISDSSVLRPLLGVSKKEILKYASQNHLEWREDSTNQEPRYLRNHLRLSTLTPLNDQKRLELVKNIGTVAKNNKILNQEIATLSHIIKPKHSINRVKFTSLPQEIADELVMHWLREANIRQFDRKTVQRLSMAIKTALPGTKQAIRKELWLKIDKKTAHFTNT